MLAAVSALAYTVGNLLRVEAYMAYILPLPIVLAALRSGPLAALKTLAVAVLLLMSEFWKGSCNAAAAGPFRECSAVAACGAFCASTCLLCGLCPARPAVSGGEPDPSALAHSHSLLISLPPPPNPRVLAVLMGPVRAVTYLLVYGVLSVTLGLAWAWRLPWALSVPLGALSRIGGYMAYIVLSSWVTNENL